MIKICSGGQTGVDRAALDFAIDNGIPHGGHCPKNRKAEDGKIPEKYNLIETNGGYKFRTELNVQSYDATLIFYRGTMGRGTQLTCRMTEKYDKPRLCVNLDFPHTHDGVLHFIDTMVTDTLNVAGTRESSCPGIYDDVYKFLTEMLAVSKETGGPL